MPVNRLSYTDSQTVRRVYDLARVLARLFEAAGLRYWTSGGTTLGILRSSHFSPLHYGSPLAPFDRLL